MDEADVNSCQNCGAVASDRCGGCKATKYCSTACQKQNWTVHKNICGKNGLDLAVHRAGLLIQDLYLMMREATYENTNASIKEEGHNLVIQDAPVSVGKPAPFAYQLVRNDAQKNMALSAFTCEEPIAFFHDILVQMMEGTGVEIDVLWADMKPMAKKVLARAASGVQGDTTDFPHAIIRIKSTDGMSWILDITGSQYGIFRICWPEAVYMKEHVLQLCNEDKLGIHKVKYQKKSGPFVRHLWRGTEKIETTSSAWKTDTGSIRATLVRELDTIFQENANRLIADIKKALNIPEAQLVAMKTTNPVTKAELVTNEESKTASEVLPRLIKDSRPDQGVSEAGRSETPVAVQNEGHLLGACPDDEDSDTDYEDDDDVDYYDDDYYGDESLDRAAEVRSCGRLQREYS